MTLSDYQSQAARTASDHMLPEKRHTGLNCAAMGLAGEAGEFCDEVKKVQHHGKTLDPERLKNELGDVLWYVAHTCNVMGWSLEDVARANIEKLWKRYPNGFSTEAALARVDVK